MATSSADLGMLCNILGMLSRSLADLGMLLQGPKSPTSKRNSFTCCLISYEAKRVVYHQASIYETWWYTTPLASQLIRQLLWELKMCRLTLQLLGMLGNILGRPRHALQRPRHALQGPWPTSACFYKVLGVPHRRETPPLAAL